MSSGGSRPVPTVRSHVPDCRTAPYAVRRPHGPRNIVDSGLCTRTSAVPDWLAHLDQYEQLARRPPPTGGPPSRSSTTASSSTPWSWPLRHGTLTRRGPTPSPDSPRTSSGHHLGAVPRPARGGATSGRGLPLVRTVVPAAAPPDPGCSDGADRRDHGSDDDLHGCPTEFVDVRRGICATDSRIHGSLAVDNLRISPSPQLRRVFGVVASPFPEWGNSVLEKQPTPFLVTLQVLRLVSVKRVTPCQTVANLSGKRSPARAAT